MKLSVTEISGRNGYGNVAKGLHGGLAKLGVELVHSEAPAPVRLWILPPHFINMVSKQQQTWCFSMWEAAECPEGLFAGFGNFDGFIVPTEENLTTWGAHHPNVHKVPIGVDHEFWHQHPRTYKQGEEFRFLYTGHSKVRKGGDVAQKALAILAKERNVVGVPANGAGPDESLRQRYFDCHAYLQPSRGEGWGMMPHQALATGMPAVISDCSGHREYNWLPGAYTTATHEVPSVLDCHGDSGMWWEPDLDDLVTTMRWMVDNYEEARAGAWKAHELCVVHYDWGEIALRVIEILGEENLNLPDPEITWEKPKFLWFPVTTTKNLTCDIGETRYHFEKGVPQDVPADAKRVLVTAGFVDL